MPGWRISPAAAGAGIPAFTGPPSALSLTIVVVVALVAVFGVVHILTLLAVIPLIAGTVLMTRPAAASWADQEPQ